jgi:hypothetical protein
MEGTLMTNWQVTIDSNVDDNVTDDNLVELAVLLADDGGAVSGAPGRVSVILTVDADSASSAIERALTIWHPALVARGFSMARVTVVGVRAATYAEVDVEMARPTIPELVGANEAGQILGVTRQRIHQLATNHPTFPTPVVRVAMGPLWTRASVEAWKASGAQRPVGRPARSRAIRSDPGPTIREWAQGHGLDVNAGIKSPSKPKARSK